MDLQQHLEGWAQEGAARATSQGLGTSSGGREHPSPWGFGLCECILWVPCRIEISIHTVIPTQRVKKKFIHITACCDCGLVALHHPIPFWQKLRIEDWRRKLKTEERWPWTNYVKKQYKALTKKQRSPNFPAHKIRSLSLNCNVLYV